MVYEWLRARLPALLDCRPIFLADAVSAAVFDVLERRADSDWGLGIEVVLAVPSRP